MPDILLLITILIALGFDFTNGFHDTANAIADADRRTTQTGTWKL